MRMRVHDSNRHCCALLQREPFRGLQCYPCTSLSQGRQRGDRRSWSHVEIRMCRSASDVTKLPSSMLLHDGQGPVRHAYIWKGTGPVGGLAAQVE
jgi:hypothetical protein